MLVVLLKLLSITLIGSNEMVILHIANLSGNKYSGVDVVVPQHLFAQSKYVKIAFVNISDFRIDNIQQFDVDKISNISVLSEPFNKPDLVVFHMVYHFKYIKLYKILLKNNIPYIIIPHGCLTDEAQNKKWLKKKIGNFLYFNKFIINAIAIQCLSQKELENTNFGKTKFIGTNGIDLPKSYKIYFNKNKINIVFIGRLDVYIKGIDLMINAIGIIAEKLRKYKAEIKIFGPIDKNNKYIIDKLIKENNVKDLVTLNEAVTGLNKGKILLESDVFIQTSRSEGMPMGILEAMSYGLPCLVTRGTSLGEIIEKYDAGWVCETNAESIAEYIIRCIKEKDLFKLKGLNARKLIEENFTWNKVSSETVNHYKELIG